MKLKQHVKQSLIMNLIGNVNDERPKLQEKSEKILWTPFPPHCPEVFILCSEYASEVWPVYY